MRLLCVIGVSTEYYPYVCEMAFPSPAFDCGSKGEKSVFQRIRQYWSFSFHAISDSIPNDPFYFN
jgi:hypothetical protein